MENDRDDCNDSKKQASKGRRKWLLNLISKKIPEWFFYSFTLVTSGISPANASGVRMRNEVRNCSSTVQMVNKGKSEEIGSVRDFRNKRDKVKGKGRGRSLKEKVVIDVEIVDGVSSGVVVFPKSKTTMLAVVPKVSESVVSKSPVKASYSPILMGKTVEGVEFPAKIKERLINVNSTVRVVKKKTRKSEKILLELIFSLWLVKEFLRHIERLEKVQTVLNLRGGALGSIPGVPGPLLGVANWMMDKATKRLEKSMREKEEGKTVLEQTTSLTKDLLMNPFLLLGMFLVYVYVKERHPDVHISIPLPTIFPEKKKTWETRGEDLVKLIKRKPVTFLFLVFALYNWRKLYKLVVNKEYRDTTAGLVFNFVENQRQSVENLTSMILEGSRRINDDLIKYFNNTLKKNDADLVDSKNKIELLVSRNDNCVNEIHQKDIVITSQSYELKSCANELNSYAGLVEEYKKDFSDAKENLLVDGQNLLDAVFQLKGQVEKEGGDKAVALIEHSGVNKLFIRAKESWNRLNAYKEPKKKGKNPRPGDEYIKKNN